MAVTKTMVKIKIDGKEYQTEEGKTVMEVTRDNLIYIPSLCDHEGIAPYGACRLCMVEVERRGRTRLVTACLYPVEKGLTVKTDTPKVIASRNMTLQFLLARCPDSDVLQQLAVKLGVENDKFPAEDGNKKCILCALCARACEEVVGQSAISLANRGVDRQQATPFNAFSEACIACGSCAYVCPTGAIQVEDIDGKRRITMPHTTMEFPLKQCAACGRYFAPEKQLRHIIKKANLPDDFFDKCTDCRD
ncbi:2Fe-2S iron-sulfur cluster-binding protein [Chloroflexota bacterium]